MFSHDPDSATGTGAEGHDTSVRSMGPGTPHDFHIGYGDSFCNRLHTFQ